ncbi:MAG TPA: glycosyltransferase family 1 protein [Acidobacteriota bacterium]|nr:glycosyltransferase family 1 protein [Acidobacteriota bacterium]
MIVGVDARELEGKATGVGTYLREILRRLQLPEGAELQLFFRNSVPGGLEGIQATAVLLPSRGSNLQWQQWTLRREASRRKVSLLFSPANSLPWYFRGLQALTVHDLSFFHNPRWFSVRERISRQLNTSISLRHAARIYTVSEYVKQELISRFRIPPGRILVTPNGVAPVPEDPGAGERLRKAHGFSDDKIILYVGSVFNRRRLPVLIEAVKLLDASCRLVVIGENRTHPYQDLAAAARRHGVADRVRLLEYVPDQTVKEYYRMADVFVYLSEYEGFGIPPLEAMSYGVPAVISPTPAMNTVFEGSALVAREFRADAVAEAIRRVLTDREERERLIRAGRELAGRYNWEETARIISRDWEQILAACR